MARAKVTQAAQVGIGSIVNYVIDGGAVRPAIVTAVDGDVLSLTVFYSRADGYGADNAAIAIENVIKGDADSLGTWYA